MECHIKNADDKTSFLWYHVGNGLIRFSSVEFCLVSGLAFGEYSESTIELFKRKNSRFRRIYFQASKVKVKMIVDWFRNLGPNNKISDDDDVVKDYTVTLFFEKNIFQITIYETLGPIDEEARKHYLTDMDKLKYVSLDVDGCVSKDDVQDDADDAIQDDTDGDHPTRTSKKVEVRGKKK
ncbi:hypothetical protein LWI29_036014 [Acer saccharum]|uniref:Uncharacterized protein n=1 Tax=Acer saccharum TaxID=4024 RepID=A0AA39S8H1_ACESA|nr:hypothetical protein LWI29_036014 [Acer saccharum]